MPGPLKNRMGLDYGLQLFEKRYHPYLYYVLLVGSQLFSIYTSFTFQEPPMKHRMGLDYGLQLFVKRYRPYLHCVLLVGSRLFSGLTSFTL